MNTRRPTSLPAVRTGGSRLLPPMVPVLDEAAHLARLAAPGPQAPLDRLLRQSATAGEEQPS
ncbi:hypothetical protein ABT354_20095 [Streptomyces sp. NPDC000594]|uniref:hypothetical protein n=1 Tax=Streptomyces sp. NPDC000594 TaxID=3154261 RepID=UPI003325DD65